MTIDKKRLQRIGGFSLLLGGLGLIIWASSISWQFGLFTLSMMLFAYGLGALLAAKESDKP